MFSGALEQTFDHIWADKYRFFAVFMGVVTLTYAFLYAIDFIPEAPEEAPHAPAVAAISPEADEPTGPYFGTDRTPDRIIIDELNRDVRISNPTSSSVASLDAALLEGVVRHPASADLVSEGTVFLFGHSSYLPTVINKNFQAFNGINKLTWGDTIRLQSADAEYVYRVDRVYEVKASTAEVQIDSAAHKLTLVTCNTFGSKDDRYVVEATLIDSYPL